MGHPRVFMPKPPKKTTKTHRSAPEAPIPAANEPDQLLARARGSISTAIGTLDDCINDLSAKLHDAKTYDRDDASHLAWLTKHVAQIIGEIRKLEDHERKQATKLSPVVVLEHLRSLEPEQRRQLITELEEMDAGSVLS